MDPLKIQMDDVHKAQAVLKPVIRKTPLMPTLSLPWAQKGLHFKFENQQVTGSFKIRGALNKVSDLSEEDRQCGVIAASAGNHAQGVAYSAKRLGVQCQIVMPLNAPLVKVSRTKSYGAEVILHGHVFDEAYELAREISNKKGAVFVHPYQDPLVIAGQATIGLEVLEALPDIDNIVVPIGGGGLISGIAFVLKSLNPKIKVFGVTSDQATGMKQMIEGRDVVPPSSVVTIADGIAVKHPSSAMFDHYISQYVDSIVSVSDDEISQAIVFAMENEKTILEGSGAAGLAAVLSGRLDPLEGKTCVVLCGGNIDLNMVNTVIDTGLRRQGRLSRISTIIGDLPGSLAKLTQIFADHRANVLDVIHDRVSIELAIRETRIDFLLETMSLQHIGEIKQSLRNHGYRVLEE